MRIIRTDKDRLQGGEPSCEAEKGISENAKNTNKGKENEETIHCGYYLPPMGHMEENDTSDDLMGRVVL